MSAPRLWGRAGWARAAVPALPEITTDRHGRMSCEATTHRAVRVDRDRWVFSGLRGRQLTDAQVTAAMRLAVCPDRLEADGWARSLGLTVNEAKGLFELAAPGEELTRVPERDWGFER